MEHTNTGFMSSVPAHEHSLLPAVVILLHYVCEISVKKQNIIESKRSVYIFIIKVE